MKLLAFMVGLVPALLVGDAAGSRIRVSLQEF
jgi:hypothetical protein